MNKLFTAIVICLLISINSVKAQIHWDGSNPGSIYYNGGNVGIGTINPSQKLTIEGIQSGALVKVKNLTPTAYAEQTFYNDNNNILTVGTIGSSYSSNEWAGSSYMYSDRKLYIKSADKIDFFSGGYSLNNIRMSINNNGNVGIGTTNPNGQLQINSIRPIIFKYNGGSGVYGSEIGFNAILNTYITPNRFIKLGGTSQQGGASIIVDNWGSMYFQTYNASTESESIINYNPQITFQNNGYVGIGTTTPDTKLTVNTDNFGDTQIKLLNTGITTTFSSLMYNVNSGEFRISQKDGGNTGITFYTNYSTNNSEKMRITPNGNVGIGVTNPQYKLTVAGTIAAREVNVTTETWSDFVFHSSYKLRSLGEVEQFIKANSHLPEIPSAAEVKENGIGLGEMNAKLLQKIEELTLYMIEQQKQMAEQQKYLLNQQKQLNELKLQNQQLSNKIDDLKK